MWGSALAPPASDRRRPPPGTRCPRPACAAAPGGGTTPTAFAQVAFRSRRNLAFLLLWATACAPLPEAALPPAPASLQDGRFEVLVLGAAQDGGLPQLGCEAECCAAARADPGRRRLRACLGVRDLQSGSLLLVEATPDIEEQVALLHRLTGTTGRGRNPVDGILVTHAHTGHYLGLLSLGRETAAAREIPLFCTERFAAFLATSPPFALLVEQRHVVPRVVTPGSPFEPLPGLAVEALPVPHRDEFSDTVAFRVRGPQRSLLFLPDIDRWERWDRDLEALVESVDVVLLDGTFFAADEVPGRSIAQIPHPLVTDTVARLAAVGRRHPGRVVFIHLNHTNRLWRDPAAVRELEAGGFRVARAGDRFVL